jgi:hypothetical protein
LNLPRRDALHDESGLEAWAASLGVHLLSGRELDNEGAPDHEGGDDGDEFSFDAEDFAAQWAQAMTLYAQMVDLRSADPALELGAWDELKDPITNLIGFARTNAYWSFQHQGDDVTALAMSVRFVVEAMFILANSPELDGAILPEANTLQALLEETGALRWIAEHGAVVPDWLSSGGLEPSA